METGFDRPVTRTSRIRLMPALLYLGVGFVFHAATLGPHLDFNDAWSYAYVLLWPAVLLLVCLKAILFVVVGLAVIGFLAFGAISGTERWERRRANRPGALSRLD